MRNRHRQSPQPLFSLTLTVLLASLLAVLAGCGGGGGGTSQVELPASGAVTVEFTGADDTEITEFGADLSIAANAPEDGAGAKNASDAIVVEGTSLELDGEPYTPQSFLCGFDQALTAGQLGEIDAPEGHSALGYLRLHAAESEGGPALDLHFNDPGVRLQIPVSGSFEDGDTLSAAVLTSGDERLLERPGLGADPGLDELDTEAEVTTSGDGQTAELTVSDTGIYVIFGPAPERR